MLPSLRGQLTPREGAGQLPAPLLKPGIATRPELLPVTTHKHIPRQDVREERGMEMSRTSYLRRPLAALLMRAALAASVIMAVVVLASPAWAATYTVNTNADFGA